MNGVNMIVTIVVINVVYVSLFTIRLLFVMKGQNNKEQKSRTPKLKINTTIQICQL